MRVTVKTAVVWVTMDYVASYFKRLFSRTSITWQHIQEDSLWVTPEYKASNPRKHLCSWWCRITVCLIPEDSSGWRRIIWRHIPEVRCLLRDVGLLPSGQCWVTNYMALYSRKQLYSQIPKSLISFKIIVILLCISYILQCGLKLCRNRLTFPLLSSLWLTQFLLRARSSRCNLTNNGTGIIAHSI